MKTKNLMQSKATIKKKTAENNVSTESVKQKYIIDMCIEEVMVDVETVKRLREKHHGSSI